MRNLPNVYCSFSPGMPVLNGVPGTLVDVFKKVLVTGTDPVAFTGITVLNNVAVVTALVEDAVFFNGSRIGITGCDEPLLNGVFEVEDHGKLMFSFKCNVADGNYGGSIKIGQPPAGWNLLFTGTNEAVFVSGNMDTLGVCVKVIDTNALYATLEFYENMTGLNAGVNKFNPNLLSANRVVRVFKSYNATVTKINYWLVADNTTVHFSNERVTTASYTPHLFDGFRGGVVLSFGEMDAIDSFNKKHFYFTSCYSVATDASFYGTSDCYVIGHAMGGNYLTGASNISGGVLTQSGGGNTWRRFLINTAPLLQPSLRVSGSAAQVTQSYKLPPFYYVSDYFSLAIEPYGNAGLSFFGKVKEAFYFNQQMFGSVRNFNKITVNAKKYICLPIYKQSINANQAVNEYNAGFAGMTPFLIGEKWGD